MLETEFSGRGKVEVSRFKGLGEMLPAQLRDTAMNPEKRQLLQVQVEQAESATTANLVEQLMGKKPELRLAYIQENARFVEEVDV